MKRYLISAVIVLVVLVVAWVALGQQQSDFRERMAKMREAQTKALEVIDQQVAKLKEDMQQPSFDRSRFQEMSEEDKTKYMEERRKAREAQQASLNTIIAQIAVLQGRMEPLAEGEQLIIVNTADLKAIVKLAEKEKAKETAERVTSLLEPPRRFGGRPGQPGEAGARQRQR